MTGLSNTLTYYEIELFITAQKDIVNPLDWVQCYIAFKENIVNIGNMTYNKPLRPSLLLPNRSGANQSGAS
jgi:hypothetical protein